MQRLPSTAVPHSRIAALPRFANTVEVSDVARLPEPRRIATLGKDFGTQEHVAGNFSMCPELPSQLELREKRLLALLKARAKIDDDTLLEVNEIAIDINTRRVTRTDPGNGQLFTSTLVEYKLAGEWFDAPKGDVGGTTSAHSLLTSVLVRMRDLDRRAERIRDDTAQR